LTNDFGTISEEASEGHPNICGHNTRANPSWAQSRILSSAGLGSMLSKTGILQMEHPTVAVTPPECHSLEMSNVDRPQISGETRFVKGVPIMQVAGNDLIQNILT